MTELGFDQPLCILPFDHRGSFQSGLFGWKGTLTAEQTERASTSRSKSTARWAPRTSERSRTPA